MFLFDPDRVLVTVAGYNLSYLEFAGTVMNLLSVVLVMRRHILTWPTGIVGLVLFGVLFYKVRLYADVFEQVYFVVTGFYGWWAWLRMASAIPGTRDGEHIREWMHGRFVEQLTKRQTPFTVVSGDREARLNRAIQICDELLVAPFVR